MPDTSLDSSCIALKASTPAKREQNKDLLGLSDISPRDKAWDKHRANADIISKYYADGGEWYFNRYAQRVSSCSEWLEFRLSKGKGYTNAPEERHKLSSN